MTPPARRFMQVVTSQVPELNRHCAPERSAIRIVLLRRLLADFALRPVVNHLSGEVTLRSDLAVHVCVKTFDASLRRY